jgi:hypothetical protein
VAVCMCVGGGGEWGGLRLWPIDWLSLCQGALLAGLAVRCLLACVRSTTTPTPFNITCCCHLLRSAAAVYCLLPLLSGWLVFTQLVETSRPFVREASMVPVYGLLAFGGQLEVLHDQGLLLLDGWAKFKAPARVSVRGVCVDSVLGGGCWLTGAVAVVGGLLLLRVSVVFEIGCGWMWLCVCHSNVA